MIYPVIPLGDIHEIVNTWYKLLRDHMSFKKNKKKFKKEEKEHDKRKWQKTNKRYLETL